MSWISSGHRSSSELIAIFLFLFGSHHRLSLPVRNSKEETMAQKPTAADAQLILELYDLRREPEMRKARNWWAMEFFPQSADDFLKVAWAMGTQENNWLRQVGGYWGIVTSFVLAGVLNEELFLQPGFSGELFLIYAKIHPFVKELREKLGDPEAFLNLEKAITRTKWGKNRLHFMMKRVETMRQRMAERKAS
jgi:hypothetical protein